MANEEQLAILTQGSEAWNAWRQACSSISVDLTGAKLGNIEFGRVDFSKANLRRADLSGAKLCGASLRAADLRRVDFSRAQLCGADFGRADLGNAQLCEADLTEANLSRANLVEADLSGANLVRTNLGRTNLAQTKWVDANLVGCRVYGMSAWDMILDRTRQVDLIITRMDQSEITVDNLEVAQFIYLMLNNSRIRHVIDTVTSKAVLILGRFTLERKSVLDALREELRRRDYLPVLFDFEQPTGQTITETVSLLARMSRFIVADITDAKSIPQELGIIVPDLPSVPVQPLLSEGSAEYSMFEHFRRYPWVLPIHLYGSPEQLIAEISERVITPVEAKVLELRGLP